MNAIFSNLSKQTHAAFEEQLSNNEVSSNEELLDIFIEDLELTLEQAEAAVQLRSQYLTQIFLLGQGPLHKQKSVAFDPTTKNFK